MKRAASAWTAITGGACALAAGIMLATTQAYVASVLALLAMAVLPAFLARAFTQRATVPVATALVLVMASMNAASRLPRAAASVLIVAGVVLLGVAWMRVRKVPVHRHIVDTTAPRGLIRLLVPALLAGLSSGLLARFQLFALCGGTSGASPIHVGVSLLVVALAGAAIECIDPRGALLMLFVVRGTMLAALTIDAFAHWASIAAAAFALLDFLTLPTLMRSAPTKSATQNGCPGFAHHAGMIAGAALATTSWGFDRGFYALFLLGGALNIACACTLVSSNIANTRVRFSTARSLVTARAVELN